VEINAVLEIVNATGAMNCMLDCGRQQVKETIEQLAYLPSNLYTQAMQQVAEFPLASTY
jgi:hypothetical protein